MRSPEANPLLLPLTPEAFGMTECQVRWQRFDRHAQSLGQALRSLSEDEQARARRFVFDVDRRRYVLSHQMLRTELARFCRIPERSVEIYYSPSGKPYSAGQAGVAKFSLSHARDVAAVALSASHEVGVDVEHLDDDASEELASRVLTPRELSRWSSLETAQRTVSFFRYWTAKEAFLKLNGTGFQIDPRCVEVAEDFAAACSQEDLPYRYAHLKAVDVGPKCIGTLASPVFLRQLRVEEWQPSLLADDSSART